jgi:hypothetical protein
MANALHSVFIWKYYMEVYLKKKKKSKAVPVTGRGGL